MFKRTYFDEQTRKEVVNLVSEETVRERLAGYYNNVDDVIAAMKASPGMVVRTPGVYYSWED